MYIPAAFRIEDAAKLADFIRRYSFATLVTQDGGTPFATHLPMLYHANESEHGTLLSHVAIANPQWKHFGTKTEALAIFHGPHAYVSPSWYTVSPAVPTWNYSTVHVYGVPEIIEDRQRIEAMLNELVATYEAGFEQPWKGDLPDEYREKMLKGIVAFEMRVTRIEGKFKLGQNRSAADVQSVFEALARSEDADSRALARLMGAEECNIQDATAD
jgi:transcriptional regulator